MPPEKKVTRTAKEEAALGFLTTAYKERPRSATTFQLQGAYDEDDLSLGLIAAGVTDGPTNITGFLNTASGFVFAHSVRAMHIAAPEARVREVLEPFVRQLTDYTDQPKAQHPTSTTLATGDEPSMALLRLAPLLALLT